MATFNVMIPVLASVTVEVEADHETDAISKAVRDADFRLTIDQSDKGYELHEWNVYDKLSEGNYFHGHINEADAEEQIED